MFDFGKRLCKPSKKLLNLCERYNVKTTKGRTDVHRSTVVLQKECIKRVKSLLVKLSKRKKSKFGSNPPLNQTMGFEYCSEGGGVTGAFGTGLYPTPCRSAPAYKRGGSVSLKMGGFAMKPPKPRRN